MIEAVTNSRHVVVSFIDALHNQRYDSALDYLHDDVRIRGPAGESFGKPTDFIEMLRKYHGRYDVKKVLTDGNDVCVWYELDTTAAKVFMASWYTVKDNKIASIQTIFDPRAFGPPPKIIPRDSINYYSLIGSS